MAKSIIDNFKNILKHLIAMSDNFNSSYLKKKNVFEILSGLISFYKYFRI